MSRISDLAAFTTQGSGYSERHEHSARQDTPGETPAHTLRPEAPR